MVHKEATNWWLNTQDYNNTDYDQARRKALVALRELGSVRGVRRGRVGERTVHRGATTLNSKQDVVDLNGACDGAGLTCS